MTKKNIFSGLFLLLGTVGILLLISKKSTLAGAEVAIVDSSSIQPEVRTEFGIVIDSFQIQQGNIKRNQHLASILEGYNISYSLIERIVKEGKNIFDFRKIRAGNSFTTYTTRDTLNILKYFVYEHSPIEYYVFDFTDSGRVSQWLKTVDTVESSAIGVIENNLWSCMVDNKINPLMANELSEIYAWVIDFFGLQVGDSFRVIYDELFVDTISMGIEKVHCAYFNHMNKDFYAIPYIQDSVLSFYDEEGNSLRRAFLKAPLRYSRVASGFSSSRFHPILKIYRPHHGVDYSAPSGTPVYAVGDGVIIKKGYYGGAGNMIKIKHNSVYTTAYLHFRGFAPGMHVGKYVKQGDLIGYVGSTGLSTGPHLDFRFYKNGHAVNPLRVEAPPVEPVKEELKEQYDSVKSLIISRLDKI